jgi:hypothetical protein
VLQLDASIIAAMLMKDPTLIVNASQAGLPLGTGSACRFGGAAGAGWLIVVRLRPRRLLPRPAGRCWPVVAGGGGVVGPGAGR